jgi:hypothetical protein
MFYVVSNIFSLIFNEVLISLHSCLDSTYTNYPATMCGVFRFLYKEIVYPIIFVIHMLKQLNTYIDVFYNTIKFFKNIILHIKLKTHRTTRGYKLV